MPFSLPPHYDLWRKLPRECLSGELRKELCFFKAQNRLHERVSRVLSSKSSMRAEVGPGMNEFVWLHFQLHSMRSRDAEIGSPPPRLSILFGLIGSSSHSDRRTKFGFFSSHSSRRSAYIQFVSCTTRRRRWTLRPSQLAVRPHERKARPPARAQIRDPARRDTRSLPLISAISATQFD